MSLPSDVSDDEADATADALVGPVLSGPTQRVYVYAAAAEPAQVRTAQDLLAERRALIEEQSRERDAIARKMLAYQIKVLDQKLAALHTEATRG